MTAVAALGGGLAGLVAGHWLSVRDGDPRLVALYSRHYSSRPGVTKRTWRLYGMDGPGESMCLMTVDCRAGWIWQRSMFRKDGQTGINCSFFRNEGTVLSSDLVREASELALERWEGERLWTYVDPKRIKSTNPGYSFKQAGWKVCGQSKRHLLILEKVPA